jgi:hypothetical protein
MEVVVQVSSLWQGLQLTEKAFKVFLLFPLDFYHDSLKLIPSFIESLSIV